MRNAVDLFGDWADMGKDMGMEQGHAPSVKEMIAYIQENVNHPYDAIDLGCGNGWVTRILSADNNCNSAIGLDGSKRMIEKAKAIDPQGDYQVVILPNYSPPKKVDVIHSMEFLYYLKDPKSMIIDLHENWLNSGGIAIFGIDHYWENTNSHDWSKKLEVHMSMMKEEEWIKAWKNAGFKDVKAWRAARSEDFQGTLVIAAHKA